MSSEEKSLPVQREHPLLPTVLEANDPEFYSKHVFSDHLPQKFSIGGLQIISWNIMMQNGGPPASFRKLESGDEYDARLSRIGAALCEMGKQADVLCLQELPQGGDAIISRQLGEEWGYKINERGLATFYKKSKLTLHKDSNVIAAAVQEQLSDFKAKNDYYYAEVQTHTFKRVETNACVEIHNVHLPFDEFPQTTEKAIQAVVETKAIPQDDSQIVIGDFNMRCVPVDTQYTNLVTSVHRVFLDAANDSQRYGWTDGCFVFDKQTSTPKQIVGTIINPETQREFKAESVGPKIAQADKDYRSILFGNYIGVMTPENLTAISEAFKEKHSRYNIEIGISANRYNQRRFYVTCSAEFQVFNALAGVVKVQAKVMNTDRTLTTYHLDLTNIQHVNAINRALGKALLVPPVSNKQSGTLVATAVAAYGAALAFQASRNVLFSHNVCLLAWGPLLLAAVLAIKLSNRPEISSMASIRLSK